MSLSEWVKNSLLSLTPKRARDKIAENCRLRGGGQRATDKPSRRLKQTVTGLSLVGR